MKRLLTCLVALMVLFTAFGAFAAAPAVAEEEDEDDDLEELLNETFAVDEEDLEVYLDVQGTNGTEVTVEFYGIDADGNETLEQSENLTAGEDEVASSAVEVDEETYDSYRVVVTGTEEPDHLEAGTVSKLAGGGGFGGLGDEILGLELWMWIVILGVVGVAKMEMDS